MYGVRLTLSLEGLGLNRLRIGLAVRGGDKAMSPEKPPQVALPADILKDLADVPGLGSIVSPFAATGRSGVKHVFAFGMTEGGSVETVGDIFSSPAPIDETKVLSLFIKVYDVGVKHTILCATPSLNAKAKELADLYKMTVVEAKDIDSAVTSAAETIRRLAREQ